ncbi:EcsC family protein [Erythrobacter sp. MTPC3]|uniref:EcsC family protein n=1 Tax=Erythrobacter sp. MTPC3 TaxID=3056564 RepID=UPI0036F3118B
MNRSEIEADQTAYRATEPSFLGRGIERLTNPLGSALAGVLPKSVVERIVKGLDKAAGMPALVSFNHNVADMDAARKTAFTIERTARAINASSGAAAGFGGAITAGADIPATIAVALRNIRDTGRAYGFVVEGEREQLFRLQILEIAALDNHAEKIERLDALEADINDDGSLNPVATKNVEPLVDQIVERISRALAFATFRRRAGMLVPVIGSAVGGFVNAQFQRDVSRAARFAFQARRLRQDA